MKSPLISIILSTYNPKKEWIVLAIQSVLAQTYDNYELLIIDDCSTNHVLEEIGDIISSDLRIKIIRNSKNLKLVRALNNGIQHSKGKYIARIDDDDIWSNSTKLQDQVDFMESHPMYGLCGTGLSTIDRNGKIIDTLNVRLSDQEIRNNLLRDSQFAHPSVLIRKSVLDDIGPYDPCWNYAEDYELWLRIGKKYKFTNLVGNCLYYRINPNGMSESKSFKQRWMGLQLTWKYRNDYPNFYLSFFLKIPYVFLPKRISNSILTFIKK